MSETVKKLSIKSRKKKNPRHLSMPASHKNKKGLDKPENGRYKAIVIKAFGSKILAEVLPATEAFENKLNLELIDKKKHFEHPTRMAKVKSVGDVVRDVKVGDVVVIGGAAGFTLDGAPFEDRPEFGESHRWLTERDCLAVVVPEGTPASMAEGISL